MTFPHASPTAQVYPTESSRYGMGFMNAAPLSPYRQPQNLARVIAPDRRWLVALVLGLSCFTAGIAVTLASDVVAQAATEESLGRAHGKRRTFEMTPPTDQMAEPEPQPLFPPLAPDSISFQARDALLANNPSRVKALLMPIVAKGGGTDDDRRMLKAACDGLKDRACLDFLRGH